MVKFFHFSYNLIVNNKKFAAIDIGTNTFRLLIAEIHRDASRDSYFIKEIHSERIITRLGEGIHESGYLKKEAIDRSITVLRKFCETIAFHDVYKTSAFATSALREAKNSNYFLDDIKKVTELPIEIISGEQEAKITATGMMLDMTVPETAFMVDIGGGSTELIFANKGTPGFVHSLNKGVVYLSGKFMKHDPPLVEDLNRMEKEISEEISTVHKSFTDHFCKDTVFIGTAGTVTTLAAVTQNLREFDHKKIHNFKLTIDNVRNIFSTISAITTAERVKYIPFEPSRLDIIVPGTLILLKIMEVFRFKEITVSNYGLREGILIHLYNKLFADIRR